MKKTTNSFKGMLVIFASIVLFFGCKTDKNPDDLDKSLEDPGSWNLIFEDEFNDLSAWNVWEGGAFNNEIQLYTEKQVNLEYGLLKINALRKNITGPNKPFDATPKKFEYVSGRLQSKRTFGPSDKDGEREYRFVARIKLPVGHGMWPAFWTYGDPWPTQGEIDILEARGGETNRFSSNIFYGPKVDVNINIDTEVKHILEQNLTEDFHVYEMIWRSGSIDILLDNTLIHRYEANEHNNVSKLFGKKQMVVFNTAVGGWFFQDQNSSNYADSSTMEVDWVRVYKK